MNLTAPRTAAAADQARAWTPQTTHHTYLSVAYSITETLGRRPEYRVRVDGIYLATEDTLAEAHALAWDYIQELCEQGLVGEAR